MYIKISSITINGEDFSAVSFDFPSKNERDLFLATIGTEPFSYNPSKPAIESYPCTVATQPNILYFLTYSTKKYNAYIGFPNFKMRDNVLHQIRGDSGYFGGRVDIGFVEASTFVPHINIDFYPNIARLDSQISLPLTPYLLGASAEQHRQRERQELGDFFKNSVESPMPQELSSLMQDYVANYRPDLFLTLQKPNLNRPFLENSSCNV